MSFIHSCGGCGREYSCDCELVEATPERVALALQDHMEQFHGVCLRASEWDAAAKAAIEATHLEEVVRLRSGLTTAVSALGRVNVRCFDRDTSPLKPIGDIAREALRAVEQIVGDETYDEITDGA